MLERQSVAWVRDADGRIVERGNLVESRTPHSHYYGFVLGCYSGHAAAVLVRWSDDSCGEIPASDVAKVDLGRE